MKNKVKVRKSEKETYLSNSDRILYWRNLYNSSSSQVFEQMGYYLHNYWLFMNFFLQR